MTADTLAILLFFLVCITLLLGYPVAFTLAGVSLWIAILGASLDVFEFSLMLALPSRLFGLMTNQTLLAVPLFIFMGVMMERSKVAEQLLTTMAQLFRRFPGGLALSVTLVGVLLAASTGIVGATVVTMGLLSLPSFIKKGYPPELACGTICATGTLGQIIPPSIALVLLGDVLSNAYQQAQLKQGFFAPETVSVGDLFAGALIPGLVLVLLYITYLFFATKKLQLESADTATAANENWENNGRSRSINIATALLPPLLLIFLVLGSIIAGFATPTEAAGVGAFGAMLLASFQKQCSWQTLYAVCVETAKVSSMVFLILVGASIFSLVFRGLGGDALIETWFEHLPGGTFSAVLVVMILIFILGFILDFIEITYVVVPLVGPILLAMGVDPVWLGIMIALNLQTSFLTPPFGFALFYLRGVAPSQITTSQLYRGVVPFIIIQVLAMTILALWPSLATWLPNLLY